MSNFPRIAIALLILAVGFASAFESPKPAEPAAALAAEIKWKKTVIDTKFRSEGVAVADVNKDGKLDVIAGDVWYAAPDWKMHEIRKPQRRDKKEGGDHDPATYSNSFCCFTDDFNGDGFPDVIVIPFPGEPCSWYENPKGKTDHWKEHPVWRSACNETPQYADLFGDGKKVLIMAIQPEGQMCWFSPSKDLDKPWEPHAISEEKAPGTGRFDHGLGVGDMNGDGRLDVLTKHGWWEQPEDAKKSDKPWKFRKAGLGDDCADMFAFDVDGDGLTDVLSSSAHKRGIWWHRQITEKEKGKDGNTFRKQDIFTDVTQTHAMHFADINGDGKKDLITGKRWWAHGPKGDDDPNADPCLYWIDLATVFNRSLKFDVHKIDDQSGVGTQFFVGDINGDGKPDIAVANKKGVFLFEQVKAGGEKPPGDPKPKPMGKAPEVNGDWTGSWDPFNPAPGATLAKDKCKQIDCKVTLKDGVWQATFEGECGRPYKYTITMEGRQVGDAVLFKGTADLGEKDGGVFDWVGRATDKEFTGFYTSATYTGCFHMTRAKKPD